MIAILILAGIGLIINLLGRWLVVHEDQGLSRGARFAVMFIPGAELMYVIMRWENGKAGSVVCALSLAFALPLVGELSLLSDRGRAKGSMQKAWMQVVDREVRRQQKEREKSDRECAITRKKEKLTELATYLNQWYRLLEQRRAVLPEQLEKDVTVFNHDAAAYHGLLKASKTEMFELKRLTDQQQNP